jgi:transmembrane sensor
VPVAAPQVTPPPVSAVAPPAPAPAAVAQPRTETAESLLAAADAARVAGRPGDGAALLRRVLDHHGGDPRAPLAAFTLGRVLLMELGQPREAAAVFARARALAPEGPFAEDALAREVEALAKAGNKAAATTRAQEYHRLYPSGRRAPAVRALGGGE